MPNLFPSGYMEEVVSAEALGEKEIVGFKGSVYFDKDTLDFVRDGQYRVKSANGIEAWEQWCMNCLQTERDKYPCYGSTFGISIEEAMKTDDRKKAESILTREISESLERDPYGRTKYVSEVSFHWMDADALEVTVSVYGIEDVSIEVRTIIDLGLR